MKTRIKVAPRWVTPELSLRPRLAAASRTAAAASGSPATPHPAAAVSRLGRSSRDRSRREAGRAARRPQSSSSATSAAVWILRRGSLASSLAMTWSSQSGTSGLSSRNGAGTSSAIRRRTAERPPAGERQPAGAEGVEHAAQAEQVGPMVDRLAARLLGRHELRRADDDPVVGQAGIIGRAGQAEVDDLDAPRRAVEQDVGRLDVAVDQAVGMRGGQAESDLPPDPDDFLERHRARRGRADPGASRPGCIP